MVILTFYFEMGVALPISVAIYSLFDQNTRLADNMKLGDIYISYYKCE